jgi:GT2 family glycosyltransferase
MSYDNFAPSVSVVIPTFQREVSLLTCLSHLAAASGSANAEVIVVDQTPRIQWLPIDDQVLNTFFSFDRIFTPKPNLPAARNLGASVAQAKIFLFLDDDVEVEDSYLTNLIEIIEDDQLDVVGGECVNSFSEMTSSNIEPVEWLPGINTALRQEYFYGIGGYDENLPYNEDAEFCHRLRSRGLRIGIHKSLRVIHYHRPTGGIRHHPSLFKTARTIMQSDLYFTRAVGGGLPHILKRAFVTTKRESLGLGRIQRGTIPTRVLACGVAAPSALIYAFRKPQLSAVPKQA